MTRPSKHATRVVTAVAAIVGAVIACGGDGRSDGDGRTGERRAGSAPGSQVTAGASAAATGASAASVQKPICPATGAWQMCSVIERLERAGFAVRREHGAVREEPISIPGVAFMLGPSELRVFLYADRAARERDQAKLDATKYIDAAMSLSMPIRPTLITSENLLAILRSRSDRQRERVSDALTAGPPQSPGTKG